MLRFHFSFPTVAVAAVATAILCGEIIFPAVLPTVFAATQQIWLIFNSAPVLACNLENSTLLDVELPVTNVPIDPISGATKWIKASCYTYDKICDRLCHSAVSHDLSCRKHCHDRNDRLKHLNHCLA